MTHHPSTTMTGTMRAVTQDRYGGPEVLSVTRVPSPEPSGSEVLIQVHAAGLDRGVEHMMTGKPYAMRPVVGLRRPRNPVLGRDVAGTVVQVGTSATRFAVGDEVYGVASGSFAELALASEDKLANKPAGLSFAAAAVVPVSGATALRALTDVGRLQEGQSVLVLGASGGVGSYAVQIAKALGAEVTGVCSAAKSDLVTSWGADRVIDYRSRDWADGKDRYDLIVDIAGNTPVRRLRRALTERGTVVFVGGEGAGNITGMGRQLWGAMLVSPFVRQRLVLLTPKEQASDYQRLTDLIEAGKVVPPVQRTYDLDEAPEAVRRLGAGQVGGKVAITL